MSRAFSTLDQTPGPGNYAVQDAMKKYKEKQGMTMGARLEEKGSFAVPGPGSYKIKSKLGIEIPDKPKTAGAVKGTFSRAGGTSLIEKSTVPGPGSYNKQKEPFAGRKGGVIMGNAKRGGEPGPVKPSNDKEIQRAEMLKMRQDEDGYQNPGPGHYNKQKQPFASRKGGVVMGNARRGGEPGPANTRTDQEKQRSEFLMTKQSEGGYQNPGPGTYNSEKFSQPTKSKANIRFGCAPKVAQDLTTQRVVPGPGTYKLKLEPSKVGAAMGNEQRSSDEHAFSRLVPGPGTYQLKESHSLSTAIPHAERFVYKQSGVPGPGAYKIPGMFGNQNA